MGSCLSSQVLSVQGTQARLRGQYPTREALQVRGLQAQMKWTFFCSWPHAALFAESRCPPAVKVRASKEQKAESYLLACNVIPPAARARIRAYAGVQVRLQVVRPNKAVRDEQSIIAACNSLLTGIAEALTINERYIRVTHDMNEPPQRPGGIRVTVSDSIEVAKSLAPS